jgi:hypothetical protein
MGREFSSSPATVDANDIDCSWVKDLVQGCLEISGLGANVLSLHVVINLKLMA